MYFEFCGRKYFPFLTQHEKGGRMTCIFVANLFSIFVGTIPKLVDSHDPSTRQVQYSDGQKHLVVECSFFKPSSKCQIIMFGFK